MGRRFFYSTDLKKQILTLLTAGFFSTGRKRYGIFFLAVQTYTKKIFAIPIASTKGDDIYKAIALMMKVNFFKK